jgi:hypothetical protein
MLMKPLSALAAVILLAVPAAAQESRLPQEAAKGYAKVCVEQTGNPYSGPIATNVDPAKPCAEQGEGGGAMVIPDKKLSAKAIQQGGKNVVPVGQLWLRKWTLVVQDKSLPNDKLNMVHIHIEDKDRPMALLSLGVRKKGDGLELLVYAKENQPLQIIPLQKIDIVQELLLEIEWKRGETQADPLTLRVLGQYQAILHITRQGP